MPKFRMLRRVLIDRQTDYREGEVFDLDSEVGQRLVDGGHAVAVDDKTTTTATATTDSGSDTTSRKSGRTTKTTTKTDSDSSGEG